MSEAEQLEIVIRNLETRLRIARKNLDELNGGSTPELLTPEVVNNWERVAIQQLQSKHEKISIPTTLLLAMIHKIQANESKMNMIERTVVYGIPADFYTVEETKLLMDDIIGRKKLDQDKWAEIIRDARSRMAEKEKIETPLAP